MTNETKVEIKRLLIKCVNDYITFDKNGENLEIRINVAINVRYEEGVDEVSNLFYKEIQNMNKLMGDNIFESYLYLEVADSWYDALGILYFTIKFYHDAPSIEACEECLGHGVDYSNFVCDKCKGTGYDGGADIVEIRNRANKLLEV